jgi:N-acetylmuramic acid 6-phosphate etherase
MQATTIETFVMGCILEQSITCSLREKLDPVALASLGLDTNIGLSDRLLSFIPLQERVESQAGSLKILTDRETAVYRTHRHTTCFAVKAMTTVFTDSTERSPTFRLSPLDTTATPVRKSWIRVLTGAPDGTSAWQSLLGREFRGMEESFYRPAFEAMTGDPWLREAALKSLARAGNDEREHYDFSFEGNIKAGLLPVNGDLCLAVGIDREAAPENDNNQAFSRFLTLAEEQGATTAALQVWHKDTGLENTGFHPDIRVSITLPNFPDPLNLRAQVALKMMLNAHSTAIMAKLGRITGNTMTWVSPSNLKLIGRATSLILMHVNRMLDDERPHGIRHITYAEANAVLFDCIENHPNGNGQSAEVALCIIRIVESLRRQEGISWEETARMLEEKGLEGYLEG